MNAPVPASLPRYEDLDGPDPLAELETRIARRADEIAARLSVHTPLNLFCWLQAEHEVLARANLLGQWGGQEAARRS